MRQDKKYIDTKHVKKLTDPSYISLFLGHYYCYLCSVWFNCFPMMISCEDIYAYVLSMCINITPPLQQQQQQQQPTKTNSSCAYLYHIYKLLLLFPCTMFSCRQSIQHTRGFLSSCTMHGHVRVLDRCVLHRLLLLLMWLCCYSGFHKCHAVTLKRTLTL